MDLIPPSFSSPQPLLTPSQISYTCVSLVPQRASQNGWINTPRSTSSARKCFPVQALQMVGFFHFFLININSRENEEKQLFSGVLAQGKARAQKTAQRIFIYTSSILQGALWYSKMGEELQFPTFDKLSGVIKPLQLLESSVYSHHWWT